MAAAWYRRRLDHDWPLRVGTALIRLQPDFGIRPSHLRLTPRAVLVVTAARHLIENVLAAIRPGADARCRAANRGVARRSR